MALPTSTELKIDSTTMSCIPELVGQSNYPIWSTRVHSVLQAYSVFEFIDGTLTHNSLQDAADRNKWKMLDHRVLGLMAGTVNDSLTSHVDFNWADQQNYPSVAKAFWKKLLALFGKAGVQGQFFLFHKITRTCIHPRQATEDISSIIQLFDQLTQSGLNLSNPFHSMLILTQLPDDLFGLASTIIQTLKDSDFNTDNVTKAILADLNLRATRRPLASRISEVSGGPSSSANQMNVIRRGPPNQNQWRNQNNSGNQHQKSSNNSYQQQPGSAQPYEQKKYKGPKWSHKPGKQQKREWFNKHHQNPKGKDKAQAHEVIGFANEVVMTPEEEEAFAYLESIPETETEQMEIVEEDTGMDIAGPSSMPFHFCSSECPFWWEQDTSRAKEEEVEEDQVLFGRSHF